MYCWHRHNLRYEFYASVRPSLNQTSRPIYLCLSFILTLFSSMSAYTSVSVRLSGTICSSVCLSLSVSVRASVSLSLFVCLSLHPASLSVSVCMSVSVCLPPCLFSDCLSVCLFFCLSFWLSALIYPSRKIKMISPDIDIVTVRNLHKQYFQTREKVSIFVKLIP